MTMLLRIFALIRKTPMNLLKRFCRWILKDELKDEWELGYKLGSQKYLHWLRVEHDITLPTDFKLTDWIIRQAHKDRKPLGRGVFNVYRRSEDG